jgi:ATP-dependent HslUV protease subunit HslV
MFATAAARALSNNTDLSPAAIVEKSLHIAAGICVYTNHEIAVETLK